MMQLVDNGEISTATQCVIYDCGTIYTVSLTARRHLRGSMDSRETRPHIYIWAVRCARLPGRKVWLQR